MSQPLGFLRLPLNISLYNSILLLLIASSNVIVIICGTSLAGRSPGIVVPSSEQKQSGRTHTAGSHGGALFGSLSISEKDVLENTESVATDIRLLGLQHLHAYDGKWAGMHWAPHPHFDDVTSRTMKVLHEVMLPANFTYHNCFRQNHLNNPFRHYKTTLVLYKFHHHRQGTHLDKEVHQ